MATGGERHSPALATAGSRRRRLVALCFLKVRQRVHSSTDLEQFRRWIRRAAVITSADELFDE